MSLRQHFSTLSAFLLNRHESVNEFRHSGDISSKQLANLAFITFLCNVMWLLGLYSLPICGADGLVLSSKPLQ